MQYIDYTPTGFKVYFIENKELVRVITYEYQKTDKTKIKEIKDTTDTEYCYEKHEWGKIEVP